MDEQIDKQMIFFLMLQDFVLYWAHRPKRERQRDRESKIADQEYAIVPLKIKEKEI